MSMLGAILTPHPPVLLPEVGHGREQDISATAEAMRTAARQAAQWNPDVLVIASPHTILYGDYFHISPGEDAIGDMSAFGAPEVHIHVQYDTALREEIIRRAEKAGLRAGTLGERDAALDHGVLIPLYFLRKAGLTCPIVRRLHTISWDNALQRRRKPWDDVRFLSPAATFLTSSKQTVLMALHRKAPCSIKRLQKPWLPVTSCNF